MCLGLQIFAQGLVLPFPEAPQALRTPCLPSCSSCWGPWWMHHFGPLILEHPREVIFFVLFIYLFSCISSSFHHASSLVVALGLSCPEASMIIVP